MKWAYAYERTPEADGGVTIQFPDVPEAITYGAPGADADAVARDAEDALITALEAFYLREGRSAPLPSPARGRPTLRLEARTAAKLSLWHVLIKHTASECAREMDQVSDVRRPNIARFADTFGIDEKELRRLLDLRHRSHIDRIERRLIQLGYGVQVELVQLPEGALEKAYA